MKGGKVMKKNLVAMLAAVGLCVSMLTGCGSGSEVVGKWIPYAMDYNGEKKEFEELEEIMGMEVESLIGEISFEFEEDGTFSGTAMGEDAEGEWEETDGGIVVTINDNEQKLELDGSDLIMESGGQTVYFEKE